MRQNWLSKILVSCLIFVSFSGLKAQEKQLSPELPLTKAEKTNFKATSRYQEVMDFIWQLQKISPYLRVESLGQSAEGRLIPLIVIGRPLPAPGVYLENDQRLVLYFQANIHAGEVEAKEACLMLARELVSHSQSEYLKRLVILIAPIFNPDGNEKISPTNRRNQVGPEEGVGIRPNGLNLDLNRDAMKLESPEMIGLIQNVLLRWNPALVFDGHTHNGSYHEEPVTYVWQLNPNGDLELIDYMSQEMLPEVSRILKEKYNTLSIPHGDFMDIRQPEKGWRTLGPQPRYLTNYIGLRNRLAILNENYPYKDFKTRVFGCYHLLLSILDHCVAHAGEIKQLISQADQRTIELGMNPGKDDYFIVDYEVEPLPEKIKVLGYEMSLEERPGQWPRVKINEQAKRTYEIPFFAQFKAKKKVRYPYGYLLLYPDPKVIENLLHHGIILERLEAAFELEVEAFQLKELQSSERLFQGHHLNQVKGEIKIIKKVFPAGTIFVSTAQPLGKLAAYLLEPESDDGLLVWNFFDRYLAPQWGRRFNEYPVYKLYQPPAFSKKVIESLK